MPKTNDRKIKADDLMIIIRQDGDMRIDDKAQHEVGDLLHSKALRITLPAPKAAPLYVYPNPDSPPVQSGMAYVVREDPDMPDLSPKGVNYIARQLFEAYRSESTSEQMRTAKFHQTLKIWFLIGCFAFFIFAAMVYPLMTVGDHQQAPREQTPASEPAPTSQVIYGYPDTPVPTI